jgi:tape measure domain-containing protein
MAVKLAEAYVEITARDDALRRKIADDRAFVERETAEMGKGISQGVSESYADFGTMLRNAAPAIDAAVAIGAAVGTAIGAISIVAGGAALEVRRLEQGFAALTGGAGKAHEFLGTLRQFALQTQYGVDETAKFAGALLSVGVNADAVIPTLRRIGDAAAASPLGFEDASARLVMAFSRIKEANRLTLADMQMITSTGVPAWDYLAKAIGRSVDETKELVRQGRVTAGGGLHVIQQGMASQFGGTMKRESKGLDSRWASFVDTLKDVLVKIGEPLLRMIDRLLAGFDGLSNGARIVAGAFAYLGPYAAVLAAILVKLWPAVKAGFVSMWKTMKPGLDSLKGAWAGMRDALASVWAKLQVLFSAVSGIGISVFQKLGVVVGSIVKVLLHGISMAIHGLTSLMNTVLTVINTVLEGVREIMRWIKPFVDALRQIPLIGGVAGGAYDKLVMFLDKLINVGKGGAVKKVAEHSAELNESLGQAPIITTEDDPVVEGYGARAEAILAEIDAIKREREEAARARRDRLGIMGLADLGRRAALAGAGHQFGSDWSRIPVGFQGINSGNWRRLMSPDMVGEASRRVSMREARQDGMIKTIIDYLASIDRNTVDKTSRFGGHKGY